tara:strand:+ start:2532 stop:3461 length:930 start_codon:yes stop_codon:yes gene_type:complete
MKNIFKILFLGTPDFALTSLESIYKSKHHLCGVVTSPDKKYGRGQKLNFSPVKEYCIKKNIKLIQPDNFHDKQFIELIKSYNADIFIVVAFKILPKKIWNIPKIGTINIHASLLPNLRGAAPINWAIIYGLNETGLTSFFLDDGVDTGDIITQIKTEINVRDNFDTLYKKLKNLSGNFILETLENLGTRRKQNHKKTLLTAPKLNKTNTRINWSDEGEKIYLKVKGLSSSPGAWSVIKETNKKIIIYDVIFHHGFNEFNNGEIFIINNKLMISVKNGALEIISLKVEGKNKINGIDFINANQNNKIKLI